MTTTFASVPPPAHKLLVLSSIVSNRYRDVYNSDLHVLLLLSVPTLLSGPLKLFVLDAIKLLTLTDRPTLGTTLGTSAVTVIHFWALPGTLSFRAYRRLSLRNTRDSNPHERCIPLIFEVSSYFRWYCFPW